MMAERFITVNRENGAFVVGELKEGVKARDYIAALKTSQLIEREANRQEWLKKPKARPVEVIPNIDSPIEKAIKKGVAFLVSCVVNSFRGRG